MLAELGDSQCRKIRLECINRAFYAKIHSPFDSLCLHSKTLIKLSSMSRSSLSIEGKATHIICLEIFSISSLRWSKTSHEVDEISCLGNVQWWESSDESELWWNWGIFCYLTQIPKLKLFASREFELNWKYFVVPGRRLHRWDPQRRLLRWLIEVRCQHDEWHPNQGRTAGVLWSWSTRSTKER